MDFYFFNSDFGVIKDLDRAGFAGVLFTYNATGEDHFTRIARNIDEGSKIKYMVAMRPYVISPQYLCMINRSISRICKDRLQLNLISGHIKDEEKDLGGILGDVNDKSDSIARSNYLIDYVEALENLKVEIPDYYISVSNNFTLNVATKYNKKIIIPYSDYKNKSFDIKNKKVMVAVTPIIRKTKEDIETLPENTVVHRIDMDNFTYDEFSGLIDSIKKDGIDQIILSAWNLEETQNIIDFVKYYKENE